MPAIPTGGRGVCDMSKWDICTVINCAQIVLLPVKGEK